MNASTPRFNGALKKWNAERGFGFVVAEHADQDVFVHVSAFPRDGHPPTVGEPLSFEIELDKDGRKRAVHVRRPGAVSATPVRSRERTADAGPNKSLGRSRPAASSPRFGALFALVLVLAVGWFGYGEYRSRVAARSPSNNMPTGVMTAPTLPNTSSMPVEPVFRCDGRLHCSQMTSCREAKLFLRNCPGVQMDGDGDGVPCEQQWCTGG